MKAKGKINTEEVKHKKIISAVNTWFKVKNQKISDKINVGLNKLQ